MIAFPAAAALVSLICAAFIGWDAVKRPRPDRVTWAIAFLVFAVAAGAEVVGSTLGWTAPLARIYYLSGAVLVVGILALGELYLLLGHRMPAVAPGIALLVVAIAATVVWSAPIDSAMLATTGWGAIERGPALTALAASINAGGTIILVVGALYSALKLRNTGGSRQRALGCLLIAAGTIVVAMGGTLTRFGQREFLYLAMTAGISIIFLGILLTRTRTAAMLSTTAAEANAADASNRARLTALPSRRVLATAGAGRDDGVCFIIDMLLPLSEEDLSRTCLRWGATPLGDDPFTREQAARIWELRRAVPAEMQCSLDRLPLSSQAQLAELYSEVWSDHAVRDRDERHG